MRVRFNLLGVLLILPAALVLGQGPEQKAAIVVERDLVYGKGGDEDMKLDLARPKDGQGPFPAVVCIHAGAWRSGNRQQLSKMIELLASRGFVAVTVSYRLAPGAKFPAQIEDCKAAVRWLRRHAAKYKVNPDAIGAVGFSAGGHLACLLGTADKEAGLEGNGGNLDQSSRVQAVVSFFGPTNFVEKNWLKYHEDTFLIPFLGDTYEKIPDRYKQASPIAYVSKDDPPFLFFHGSKDTLVHISQSQLMVEKLQKAGVSAKLVTMEGDGHGWGGAKLTQTLDQTIAFFAEKLKK